jgi:ribosomal protein S6E (S10)
MYLQGFNPDMRGTRRRAEERGAEIWTLFSFLTVYFKS